MVVPILQVQIGTHSFTFDHVYGSTGSSPSAMFEECVAPLVDGLFQGYNATVLAYGQVKLLLFLGKCLFLHCNSMQSVIDAISMCCRRVQGKPTRWVLALKMVAKPDWFLKLWMLCSARLKLWSIKLNFSCMFPSLRYVKLFPLLVFTCIFVLFLFGNYMYICWFINYGAYYLDIGGSWYLVGSILTVDYGKRKWH